MTLQSVTLQLSEPIMRRARQAAQALQHPLEEVLADMLAVALPNVDDAPPEMQTELARMTWLNDDELWTIARDQMSEARQIQLQSLADLQAQRALTSDEHHLLDMLRQEYGQITLYKARAYALLSLRSGRPLLADH